MRGSAGAWSTWENSTSKLIIDAEYIKRSEDPKWFVNPILFLGVLLLI